MVYCVGLTGGIATGKSSVADLFSSLGVDVFHADAVSRDLTSNNQSVINQIIEHFGKDIRTANGELDRRRLRDIIFSDASERNWLECLLHPLIRNKLKELVYNSKTPYCVVEIPLLIDKVAYPYFNKILVVSSYPETQIARVIARDHCTREEAVAILNAQPSMSLRLEHADEVLINDSGVDELKRSVEQLHYKFLRQLSPSL